MSRGKHQRESCNQYAQGDRVELWFLITVTHKHGYAGCGCFETTTSPRSSRPRNTPPALPLSLGPVSLLPPPFPLPPILFHRCLGRGCGIDFLQSKRRALPHVCILILQRLHNHRYRFSALWTELGEISKD